METEGHAKSAQQSVKRLEQQPGSQAADAEKERELATQVSCDDVGTCLSCAMSPTQVHVSSAICVSDNQSLLRT